jgi:hypothetical protein
MATIFVARPEDPEPIEVNDFNLEWYKAQGYVQVDPTKPAAKPAAAPDSKEK